MAQEILQNGQYLGGRTSICGLEDDEITRGEERFAFLKKTMHDENDIFSDPFLAYTYILFCKHGA